MIGIDKKTIRIHTKMIATSRSQVYKYWIEITDLEFWIKLIRNTYSIVSSAMRICTDSVPLVPDTVPHTVHAILVLIVLDTSTVPCFLKLSIAVTALCIHPCA